MPCSFQVSCCSPNNKKVEDISNDKMNGEIFFSLKIKKEILASKYPPDQLTTFNPSVNKPEL